MTVTAVDAIAGLGGCRRAGERFSEEIDSTGGQLGNFPQTFTHLALINSAITLNRELDNRPACTSQLPRR